jgi:AAA15 family ATPase/GTPase/5S rRNA maturation endonuclease (ribonuclease M5)
MITKVKINNYKILKEFELKLNSKGLNIVVGNNESGKSTILEAIGLALTKRISGRVIEGEITPHLFNRDVVKKYLKDLKEADTYPELPEISIELYLEDEDELQILKGSINSERVDCCGISLRICFDNEFSEDYKELLTNKEKIVNIPSEFYKVEWQSFSGNPVPKRPPFAISSIDASVMRLQNGTDYHLQGIIRDELDPKERVGLSMVYRGLKEEFSNQASIQTINAKLAEQKGILCDEKQLSISMDISQKTSWETNLVPHLGDIPFHAIGKGEQNAQKIMLALSRTAEKSNVILIEEPENHLSYSSLNILISRIAERYTNKQILITTHNAYVLNKLGIEHVILLNELQTTTLQALPKDTQNYFKKLSGYDTLRLILSKKAILVEGPSDELLVQKAYIKQNNGRIPIQDGIDVINVRGLSFTRFLDIAKELSNKVSVITDNDGDYKGNVEEKYKSLVSDRINIHSPKNNALFTLEKNVAEINDIALLNKVLKKSFTTKNEVADYMIKNKTESALKIFESDEDVKLPDYIYDSIK